jgi:hypothetical protein
VIVGGSGTLSATLGSGPTTVYGASGTVFITAGTGNPTLQGGSGGMGVNFSASSASLVINSPQASGTLYASLGAGATTVNAGTGSSTIDAGSGAVLFGFVNGQAGGSEIIDDYSSNDNLSFAGYNYTASNEPTEVVGSLCDVITLSDNTTITLVGITHKSFS